MFSQRSSPFSGHHHLENLEPFGWGVEPRAFPHSSLSPSFYRSPVTTYRPGNPVAALMDAMYDIDRHHEQMDQEMNEVLERVHHNSQHHHHHQRGFRHAECGHFEPEIMMTEGKAEGANKEEEKKKYKFNVQLGDDFSPEHVRVNLTDDGMIRIEAKKEEESEDGKARIYQELSRQFPLPNNIDSQGVKSMLTPEGLLKIEAPLILPQSGAWTELSKPHQEIAIPLNE